MMDLNGMAISKWENLRMACAVDRGHAHMHLVISMWGSGRMINSMGRVLTTKLMARLSIQGNGLMADLLNKFFFGNFSYC
jgi:hypothetical protein